MKCKYKKQCPLYDESSSTCNLNGGMYYEDGSSPAGCYRNMEAKE